jgi:hypothetical protein
MAGSSVGDDTQVVRASMTGDDGALPLAAAGGDVAVAGGASGLCGVELGDRTSRVGRVIDVVPVDGQVSHNNALDQDLLGIVGDGACSSMRGANIDLLRLRCGDVLVLLEDALAGGVSLFVVVVVVLVLTSLSGSSFRRDRNRLNSECCCRAGSCENSMKTRRSSALIGATAGNMRPSEASPRALSGGDAIIAKFACTVSRCESSKTMSSLRLLFSLPSAPSTAPQINAGQHIYK